MKLVDGCEYVTIKAHRIIMVDGKLMDWVPDDARNEWGVPFKDVVKDSALVDKRESTRYLETVLQVKTRKPYPSRRRIKVSGIFEDDLMLAGYREIDLWLEDLLFYTYMEGMLVPHKVAEELPKKKRKLPTEEICELLTCHDLIEDIESMDVDDIRDIEPED